MGCTTWAWSPSTRSTSGERVSRSTRADLRRRSAGGCTRRRRAGARPRRRRRPRGRACAWASRFGGVPHRHRPLRPAGSGKPLVPKVPATTPIRTPSSVVEDHRPAPLGDRSGRCRCARPRPARAGRRCAPGRRSPGRGCGWTRSCSRRSRRPRSRRRASGGAAKTGKFCGGWPGAANGTSSWQSATSAPSTSGRSAGEHRVEVVPLPAPGPCGGPRPRSATRCCARAGRRPSPGWRSAAAGAPASAQRRRSGRRRPRVGRQRRSRRSATASRSDVGVRGAAGRRQRGEQRPPPTAARRRPLTRTVTHRRAAGLRRTPARLGGMDRGPSALSPEARVRALEPLSARRSPTGARRARRRRRSRRAPASPSTRSPAA